MHDLALEIVPTGKFGGIARIVAVVTGRSDQVARPPGLGLAAGLMAGGDRPGGALPIPVGACDLALETDMRGHAIFLGGFLHIALDRGAVGQDLGLAPGPELVAKGRHVRIRADARIAEQIPGAADGLAPLQHRVGLALELAGDVAGSADAGQAGANNQNIKIMTGHHGDLNWGSAQWTWPTMPRSLHRIMAQSILFPDPDPA